jgi:hypothetical protein
VAAPALAQRADPAPKPETYLCPHSDGTAIDCFLNAVDHLYTMCRHIKSIEIIEFGYEKSDEGVNGAKTAYCIDKHNLTMTRTYQSAVTQAGKNRTVVEAMRSLREYWFASLAALKWVPGERAQYKARRRPYGSSERARVSCVPDLRDTGPATTPPGTSAKPRAQKAEPSPPCRQP